MDNGKILKDYYVQQIFLAFAELAEILVRRIVLISIREIYKNYRNLKFNSLKFCQYHLSYTIEPIQAQ